MPSVQDLKDEQWWTNIRKSKARYRREGYVKDTVLNDLESSLKQSMDGFKQRVADVGNLHRRSQIAAGMRLAQRKARSTGADPRTPLNMDKVAEAGKLRMLAYDKGRDISKEVAMTGYRNPQQIEAARRLREAADDAATYAVGKTPADVKQGRVWTEKEKAYNRAATRSHYEKKAASGDPWGQRVVAGMQRNRLGQATIDLGSALEQASYAGVKTRSQYRAEHQKSMPKNKGAAFVSKVIGEKAHGQLPVTKTRFHLEALKKKAEERKKKAQQYANKFGSAAGASSGNTYGPQRTAIRTGSRKTDLAAGSKGYVRLHAGESGRL